MSLILYSAAILFLAAFFWLCGLSYGLNKGVTIAKLAIETRNKRYKDYIELRSDSNLVNIRIRDKVLYEIMNRHGLMVVPKGPEYSAKTSKEA